MTYLCLSTNWTEPQVDPTTTPVPEIEEPVDEVTVVIEEPEPEPVTQVPDVEEPTTEPGPDVIEILPSKGS